MAVDCGVPSSKTGRSLTVAIVVPTRNEADNVGELVRRLEHALDGAGWTPRAVEVLFVDDSTDDTPDRIRDVAAGSAYPVRVLHRPAGERHGGLGGAVLRGLRDTSCDWALVMDADLQHPPEVVPAMLTPVRAGGADVVVASRYRDGGTAIGLSSGARMRVSGVATSVTRLLFGQRLAACSDPMSGFFAVRTRALNLDRLRPDGFKVLLDILVRTRGLRVVECPYRFAPRHAGASKASLREGVRFGVHLARLRLAATVPRPRHRRSARLLGFGLVGVTGMVVNTAALWLFVAGAGVHYVLGALLATQVSTAWNFVLTDSLVFATSRRGHWARCFAVFAATNNAALLLRIPLLALLVEVAGLHYLAGNVAVLVLLFLLRFIVCDRFIYRKGRSIVTTTRSPSSVVDHVVDVTQSPAPGGARTGEPPYLPYRYDLHGVVRIGSQIPLPELAYFQNPRLHDGYDLEIRRGRVGTGGLRRRAVVTQTAHPLGVSYQEHLGHLGADLDIRMGTPIRVTVQPLLARSPHVVYTNVVEMLLRFLLARRGWVLLHAACVDVHGRGVLISARTDTGKTSTVLRLTRDVGAGFLSDDMIMLSAVGAARCFPKPLTISSHTLHAVHAGHLKAREWRRLGRQSRLHSRAGRAVGMWLGAHNLPVMTLNALTQWLVPPPKYPIDRLVACPILQRTEINDVFVIERGPASSVADIPPTELVDELIDNTDEAYGFPPSGCRTHPRPVAGTSTAEPGSTRPSSPRWISARTGSSSSPPTPSASAIPHRNSPRAVVRRTSSTARCT